MKTTVEKLDPTRAKLNVEVPFVELKPSVDKALKNISEQVNIPGFRKGKVPTRLIEERFGRPMIMQEAVNEALPELYRQAATEAGIRPLGQPDVSVEAVPGLESADDESDLKFTVEVDVRPDIELPEFSGYEVEIEEPEVGESAVEERLEALRERFGTLVGVDRPAAEKDFVSIDLVATIGDEEIETAEGVSYRIGEGSMLEGLDEALTGLSADEETTFTSKLAGGERAGEEATIKVSVKSVKERELPEVDDEFAQLASEFDTVEELKADLAKQAEKDAEAGRLGIARAALVEKLLAELEIPVPQRIVDQELNSHLENEGKNSDDPHREEIRKDTEDALRAQFLLDVLSETREVNVTQQDFMNYMTQAAAQYGMDTSQFLQAILQSGQMEMIAAEVNRSKALDSVLAEVTVKNKDGKVVELGLDTEEEEAGEESE
ncbi:trigger factor [Dermabacteraceae bacterium TAE3-ERU27]|nr:trigger factor [Dermabacteraceae bacterium TAE3-ERU27]